MAASCGNIKQTIQLGFVADHLWGERN